jgi:hypothetical protein
MPLASFSSARGVLLVNQLAALRQLFPPPAGQGSLVPPGLRQELFRPPAVGQASHININLWMGLGMLVIGGFFATWWRLRPLQRPEPDQPKAYETGTGH